MEVLVNTRKAENRDIDALKVRSTKNYKSSLQCPTIAALVAAFAANAFHNTKLLKSYLAGGNRIINFCRQNKRNIAIKYFDKTHMAYVFYVSHVFFLICAQKKQTLHICLAA